MVFKDTVEVVGQKIELFSGTIGDQRIVELQPVDIGDLLRKDVAGVGAIRRAGIALDPILRGMSRDRVSVLVDGNPFYGACANRMDPQTFHVTPHAIESVEITKGAFNVAVGPGVLGGVIDIKPKRPRNYHGLELHPEVRVGFDAAFSGRKGGITIIGGKAPFGLVFSYDYKDSDGYRTGRDEKKITARYQQSNVAAGLNYVLGTSAKAGLTYLGQRARNVHYPALAMDSPKDNLDFVAADVGLGDVSSSVRYLEVRLHMSRVDHSMNNGSKAGYVSNPPMMNMEAPSKSRTFGGKMMATLNLLDVTTMGVDYSNRWWDITLKRWNSTGTPLPDIRAIPDATVENLGVFVQSQKGFGRFAVEAGARVDMVTAQARAVGVVESDYFKNYNGPVASSNLKISELNVTGFFRGTYSPGDDISVFAGIARGMRTADPRERFRVLLPLPGGRWDIGNPNLHPEASAQLEIGSKGRISAFRYSLSLFYHSIDNYIAQRSTDMRFMGQPVMGYRNVRAMLSGGELSGGIYVTPNISLFGSTSYTWGENKDEDKPLPEINPWQGRIGIRYDESSGAFWVEFLGQFAARQPRFDPVVDPASTPRYLTFDARGGWRLTGSVLITAGIENLFDRSYYLHTSKTFAFNQDGYITNERLPEPGRNVYVNLAVRF